MALALLFVASSAQAQTWVGVDSGLETHAVTPGGSEFGLVVLGAGGWRPGRVGVRGSLAIERSWAIDEGSGWALAPAAGGEVTLVAGASFALRAGLELELRRVWFHVDKDDADSTHLHLALAPRLEASWRSGGWRLGVALTGRFVVWDDFYGSNPGGDVFRYGHAPGQSILFVAQRPI